MTSATDERLQVFLGTKAQYIKTAPLLRLMDGRGVDYRLIDSGQHARLTAGLRAELGVRTPDHVLGGDADVESLPQALAWAARLALRLGSPARLRREVFGGSGGICVVHGDTPTTALATLMASRAGLRVAHLEAGLRSHHLLHPFPEELIRLAVMRRADLLFAPDAQAVANLAAMGVRGRVVAGSANTSVDAVRSAPGGDGNGDDGLPGTGPAVVTMHRVENLYQRPVVQRLVDAVVELVARVPVRFVVHGPTWEALRRGGHEQRLRSAGVELSSLVPHHDFVAMLRAAPLVVTDGGSIQEECALLGVPTLVWRRRSERSDGVGANVVVSGHDPAVERAFLADPGPYRRSPSLPACSPSADILDVLVAELG
ncbi:MAG: UDP-N-acetylglucosamine 2-epimerase [Actinobacteria bacterium]|nr:UDP-N-acetylglucosamine 2-epimerase [Actinomycetota bacterium]